MGRNDGFLFGDRLLRDYVLRRAQELTAEIDGFSEDYVLSTPTQELTDYLVHKYSIDPLVLREEEIEVDHADCRLDVSKDTSRPVFDRSRPIYG